MIFRRTNRFAKCNFRTVVCRRDRWLTDECESLVEAALDLSLERLDLFAFHIQFAEPFQPRSRPVFHPGTLRFRRFSGQPRLESIVESL